MESIESSTGKTKHAESCCNGLPAFINVGELGKKSKEDIIVKNSSITSSSFAFLS